MINLPKLSLLALSILCATSASASDVNRDIYTRDAISNIEKTGGARRILDNNIENYVEAFSLAKNKKAKNVILLIGDGMGDSEITAARNFAHGASKAFKGLDALPFTGQYTHYSLKKDTRKIDYVTDSAASATAWSTGTKTYNGAIGVDVYGKNLETLLEIAKRNGLATGSVTTAEVQDATPAALYAHVVQRKCYGPKSVSEICPQNALENGGLGSISEQMLKTRPDIILGGGKASFMENIKAGEYKGQSVLDSAKAQGFDVFFNKDGLNKVSSLDKGPYLGLFSDGNMPIRLIGPQAKVNGNQEAAVKCEVNKKRSQDIPTLKDMTAKAIELLSQNEKGFFLQIEGASIDKQAHASNPCGQFGETMDLDEAVQVALDFAKKDGNTLVIVTADHAHATQIIYDDVKTPSYTQKVLTADNTSMTISYGNSLDIDDAGHTGTQLRVAAYGPSALNVVGLTDQTDIFFTIKNALNLK